MRIVAGSLKGRTVDAPEGMDTRPTTDRVREALFSSLYSLLGGFEGLVVLDAFAGSGALGVEALSRGAERAVFCERDPKAAAVLAKNIRACGLDANKAQVVKRDVFKTPFNASAFDLVFLDPPYAYEPESVLSLVESLADAGALADDAVVVYEHALANKDSVIRAATERGFAIIASRKYGKTGVTMLEVSK